ncbi:MAG: group III truncated hemoglobin [Sphingobacteriales bacterium]|nr:MAG: group III truncated hemoglobin [Sphingobacteriales bacterium]
MKNDITTGEDIENLVNSFYSRARADETIGPVFNTIIGDNWSHHLPVMYQFWEMIAFGKQDYSGSPIGKHIAVDRKMPLTEAHYQRWLELWRRTVDDLFEGEKAEEVKKRAMLMIQLIELKVNTARGGKSLF